MATNIDLIQASGGDWATIALWEADTDINLVSAGNIEIGRINADENFNESVTIAGATTDASNYRILTVADANWHKGNYNTTSGRMIGNPTTAQITINENYFMVERLIISHDGQTPDASDEAINVVAGNIGIVISRCIIRGDGVSQTDGIYCNPTSSTTTVINIDNCVIYDWGRTGIFMQWFSATTGTVVCTTNIDHVTVHDCDLVAGDGISSQSDNDTHNNATQNWNIYNTVATDSSGSGGDFDDAVGTGTNPTWNWVGTHNGCSDTSLTTVGLTTSAQESLVPYLTFVSPDNRGSQHGYKWSGFRLLRSGRLRDRGTNRIGSEPDSRQDFALDIAEDVRGITDVNIGCYVGSAEIQIPELIASSSFTTATGTGTESKTLPGAPLEGDCIVVILGNDLTMATTVPGGGAGVPGINTTGYFIIYAPGGSAPGVYSGGKIMTATPDTNVVINQHSTRISAGMIQVWRNIDTVIVIDTDTGAAASGGTGAPNPPSITPNSYLTLGMIVGWLDDDNSESAVTVPSGFSDLLKKEAGAAGGSSTTIMMATKQHNGAPAADNPAAFGGSLDDAWVSLQIAWLPLATEFPTGIDVLVVPVIFDVPFEAAPFSFDVVTNRLQGATPKGLMVIAVVEGAANARFSVGFTDGVNQRCHMLSNRDNLAAVDGNRSSYNDAVMKHMRSGDDGKLSFNRWLSTTDTGDDTSGVRIDITEDMASQRQFMFVFYAGDEVEVEVGEFVANPTQNLTTTVTPGFEAEVVFFAGNGLTIPTVSDPSDSLLSFGCAVNNATIENVTWIANEANAITTTAPRLYISDNRCGGQVLTSLSYTIEVTSFTGTTFVATTRDGGSGSDEFSYMAIGFRDSGRKAKAALVTSPTVTGDWDFTTSFVPQFVMFGTSNQETAEIVTSSTESTSYGVACGGYHIASTVVEFQGNTIQYNVGTTNTANDWANNRLITIDGGDQVLLLRTTSQDGQLVMNNDGFTINISSEVITTGLKMWYLAIEAEPRNVGIRVLSGPSERVRLIR